MDVKFYEVFEEEENELKRILPENIKAEFTPKTIQESGPKSLPAKLISVRTQSRIPPEWGHEIKGILTRSQGYDHLLKYRRETGGDIACGFLGNYCARAVAEQAILMMMALLRKLKRQENIFSSFCRDGLTGLESKGRKALVVGVGNIGKEIADIARGLKMEVKGVDLVKTLKELEYVSLLEGIKWAEVVLCALSLTDETNGMLNYHALKEARPGLIFINIARGEIAPMEDLNKLLEEDKISGIGLDVFEQEDLLADSLRAKQPSKAPQGERLLKLSGDDRILFTPHNAFNTEEALKQKAALTVESVISYLGKGTFPYPVPDL